MAETNSPPAVDDSKPVTEDDLRALKYPTEEVETLQEEDEPSEGTEAEEAPEETPEEEEQIPESEEEEAPAEPSFVKQFENIKGDTPEEYAKNLEIAYGSSFEELKRIREEKTPAPPVTPAEEKEEDTPAPKSATELYVQQKLDEDIQTAFSVIQKDYPQVSDPAEYAKFTREVATFSRTILDGQSRLAPPAELYAKAAISLGWEKKNAEPDSKEKLAQAVKDGAASSNSAAPSKPKAPGPKVSEAQLKLNRKMYPGKTDQEIIDELTPYL